MGDVLAIRFAAMVGAAISQLYWLGELARASFLPPDSPWRTRLPALNGKWLALAILLAVVCSVRVGCF